MLRGVLRSPRVNELEPRREFWDAPQLLEELHFGKYFSGRNEDDESTPTYPPALQVRCHFARSIHRLITGSATHRIAACRPT